MTTVGITGTNGKTTTAWLVRAILEAVGQDCGLIGTTGYELGETKFNANVRGSSRIPVYSAKPAGPALGVAARQKLRRPSGSRCVSASAAQRRGQSSDRY